MKNIELSTMTGFYRLTGVEPVTLHNNANGVMFELNEKTYLVVEDEEDGYRSSMEGCFLVEEVHLSNTFPGVMVCGVHVTKSDTGECDILTFYLCPDFKPTEFTEDKVVLRVGTAATDDYYPWFVMEFHPERLGEVKNG